MQNFGMPVIELNNGGSLTNVDGPLPNPFSDKVSVHVEKLIRCTGLYSVDSLVGNIVLHEKRFACRIDAIRVSGRVRTVYGCIGTFF